MEQLSRQVAGKEDRKKFKQIIRKKLIFFGRWEKIRLSIFLGLKGLGHEMNSKFLIKWILLGLTRNLYEFLIFNMVLC